MKKEVSFGIFLFCSELLSLCMYQLHFLREMPAEFAPLKSWGLQVSIDASTRPRKNKKTLLSQNSVVLKQASSQPIMSS